MELPLKDVDEHRRAYGGRIGHRRRNGCQNRYQVAVAFRFQYDIARGIHRCVLPQKRSGCSVGHQYADGSRNGRRTGGARERSKYVCQFILTRRLDGHILAHELRAVIYVGKGLVANNDHRQRAAHRRAAVSNADRGADIGQLRDLFSQNVDVAAGMQLRILAQPSPGAAAGNQHINAAAHGCAAHAHGCGRRCRYREDILFRGGFDKGITRSLYDRPIANKRIDLVVIGHYRDIRAHARLPANAERAADEPSGSLGFRLRSQATGQRDACIFSDQGICFSVGIKRGDRACQRQRGGFARRNGAADRFDIIVDRSEVVDGVKHL